MHQLVNNLTSRGCGYIDDLICFCAGQDKRRSKADGLALWHGAGDEAFFASQFGDTVGDGERWIETFLGSGISYEFDGQHEAYAADFAGDRQVVKSIVKAGEHVGSDVGCVRGKVFALQDVKVGVSGGYSDGVTGVGVTVGEDACLG